MVRNREMLLGGNLSQLRKNKGLSQENLAESSNISLRTIQRIETGTATPRPYTIKTLAETLGVPVEQLSSSQENPIDQNQIAITKLKLINFSSIAGLAIPFSNLYFTILFWRKNREIATVNEAGKKIISFQLFWTLGTILIVFLTPFIQYSIIQSHVIGHLPPTVFLVYIVLLVLNLVFTIQTARQLQKGKLDIYPFIPALF